MVRRLCLIVLTAVCVGMTAGATRVLAQAPAGQEAFVPLKVSIAIIRLKGNKETGRLPFELWVNTGTNASLQVNSDVPVPQTTLAGVPTTSYQYRSLGTVITCGAKDLGDGRYRLDLGIEDSQMLPLENAAVQGPKASFQSFRATTQVLLRDGQTVQHSLATDKVSGEVVKVEITAQVIK